MPTLRLALFALLAVLAPPIAAAPFAVADTVPDADLCIWQLDAAPETQTAVLDGTPRTCRLDLSAVAPGAHTIRVKVRNAVWGSASDSPFSSLDFARPSSLTAPGSLRLTP